MLQTTALVNEDYLRLVDGAAFDWRDRAHFFAVSAQMMGESWWMRHALAWRQSAGGFHRMNHSTAVNLDEIPDVRNQKGADLIDLDDALNVPAPARIKRRIRMNGAKNSGCGKGRSNYVNA